MRRQIVQFIACMAIVGCTPNQGSSDGKASGTPAVASKVTIENTINNESTFAYLGKDSFDQTIKALMEKVEPFVGVLPEEERGKASEVFDAKKRVAKIGFDPATAEGWKSIGIDPALGIYAVFDAAILEAGDTPIVALGVTDLDKLLAFAKKSGKEANIVADEGGLKRVVAGTETIGLIGTKGDYTYFCPKTNRGSLKAVRAAFTEFLKNSGTAPKVSLIPGKAAAGQFIAGVDLQKLLKQLKKLGKVDAADLDYYAERFESMGFRMGGGEFGMGLRASKTGQALLDKLFGVPSDAKVGRFFGEKDWYAIRMSLNLNSFFQGVAELVPPSKPQERMMISMAPAGLAMNLGVSMEMISAALSGHFAFGVDIGRLKDANPVAIQQNLQILAVLEVKDKEATQRLIEALLKKLETAPNPMLKPSQVKVGGKDALQWVLGPVQPTLVVHDDAVLIGLNATAVKDALARHAGKNFAKTEQGKTFQKQGTFIAYHIPVGKIMNLTLEGIKQNAALIPLPPEVKNQLLTSPYFKEGAFGEGVMTSEARLDQGIKFDFEGDSSMILTAVGGIAAAVAIPTFIKYTKRAKTAEASMNMYRLGSAQQAYYEAQEGEQPKRFTDSTKLTPGNPTKFMCKDGKSVKFGPDKDTFAAETWKKLGFQLQDPFFYAYQIETRGDGANAQFTVRAVGDLDCDGDHSTFERIGNIVDGEVKLSPLFTNKELE